ncbi:MAG: thiol reductant ABC exporter subunit CydC, partial [Calditrichaeota bacterium]|nr:thiol reductant ABC exporter subunit CydC [Calditrichota bacterium]
MRTFIRLLGLSAEYKWWMLLAAFTGFLTVGSSVGLLMTSAYIIAKAALHPSVAVLAVAIVGVRFFGISRGIFRYIERNISHEVTFRILAKLRVWFYRAVEPLAPARLMQYRSGDLLSRVIGDIEALEHFYIRVLAPPAVAVMIVILMWFLFNLFSSAFALILIIFLVVAGAGVPLLTQLMSNKIGKELVSLRSQLSVMTIDGVQGLADLLAFGQAGNHFAGMEKLNRKLVDLQRRMAMISGLHESIITLLMNTAVFVLMIAAIPQVSATLLDGVYLSVLAMGTMAAFEAVMPLPQAAQYLQNNLKAAERLFEMTDAKPLVAESAKTQASVQGKIKFNHVTFSYTENDPPALIDLCFEIHKGEKIAIVGPSGAGKSSIANLLLRFWDFQQGEIKVGENSLKDISGASMRAEISFVSQNAYFFNGSIKENLLLAKPKATENEMINACRAAHIHNFCANLSKGYDTQIGEHGLLLSGGERQRLAIAQMLLKGSPIIIYDEPTANLDVITEQKILKTVWELANKKTTILITHRLVGLENADKILVLKNGKIIERGTH